MKSSYLGRVHLEKERIPTGNITGKVGYFLPESQRERRAVCRIFPDRAPGESEGYQTDAFGRHTIFCTVGEWAGK